MQAKADRKISEYQQSLLFWATENLRSFPWREASNDPYKIVIAEILLKRTTANAAARIYPNFINKYPSLKELSETGIEELILDLKPLGLSSQRAHLIKKMCTHLNEVCGSEIPDSFKELLEIPGLGDYSARAVMSFTFDCPKAVVDSNVVRILRRVFSDLKDVPFSYHYYQPRADQLLPTSDHKLFNFALLDLGSLVCRPVNPKCEICPITGICEYANSDLKNSHLDLGSDATTLKSKRISMGISRTRLSDISGVAKSTILNMEMGRTEPRATTLSRLNNALDKAVKSASRNSEGG